MSNRQNATIVNILWSFFEQLLRKGFAVLITLILAWILSPDDFGLVAIITIFMAVSYAFIDGGLRSALIRRKEVSELELNSVFYTNIVLSVVIYALLFIFAPIIAGFYGHDILADLIRVAGLSIIFQSFSIVHQTLMQRRLQFKLQIRTTLPAAIFSGVIAIVIAYLGFGVWAIISQMVIFSLLNSILFWMLKIWRPQMLFSLKALKPLVGFGGFVLVDVVSREFFSKMYLAVIGKVFVLNVAGLYFFADKIKELVIQQLSTSIQHVTYPALSQIQDDDERLKQGYRKVIQLSVFLIFPILILMSALAHPLFEVLRLEKWFDSIPYLQLMLILALLSPLNRVNNNIWLIKDKPKWVMYSGFAENILSMSVLYLSLDYGVLGILIGHLIVMTLVYLIKIHFTKNLINYLCREQLGDVLPTLFLALVVGYGVNLAVNAFVWPSIVKLVVLGGGGLIMYWGISHIFKFTGYKLFKPIVLSQFRNNK